MPTDWARPDGNGSTRLRFDYQRLVNGSVWIFVASGGIALVEPSPYDFFSFVAIPLWFLGGFTVHRFILPFFAIIFLYVFGGFLSLLPHLDESDPLQFMLQSTYLAVTVVFFALFFAERTVERAEVCLQAFALSTVYASALGIVGYFGIGGTQDLFTTYGRASGTFKDPNVLGSYLILGALYYMQQLILGRTRHVLLTAILVLIQVGGVFLAFSRGSWGAFLVASAMMVALTYRANPDRRTRRRIVVMLLLTLVVAGIGLAVLLSVDEIRDVFLQRASGLQEYDEGETGRFGNQLHSIALLLKHVNGLGPVRFRLTFGLDPHNSYINSFASYGWLGGASFFLLVGLTLFIGFRLSLSASPYSRAAHVFWPSLFVFLVQGFQIDIDHWRHVYLMLGAVWGLETARIRWLSSTTVRPVADRALSFAPTS